jgi:hypothetical protein
MMRPLPVAEVFSRIELRALGWSDSAINRAVRSGRLIRLRRDQFAAVEANPRLAAIAAQRACGDSVISHRSGAMMHGTPLYAIAAFRPDLTVQPGQTGDVAHALLHRATLRKPDVVMIDGVPVTSPARTAIDLARHVPTVSAVVALDYLLHEQLTTWDELAQTAAECHNWPGIGAVRHALALADGRSESVLESISRLTIARLGLPKPRPQVRVYDEHGIFRGRTDFFWDDFDVFGEADGALKYEEEDTALLEEKERQEGIERLGLTAVRWGWSHATRNTDELRRRVLWGFERARYLKASGFPRRWSVSHD